MKKQSFNKLLLTLCVIFFSKSYFNAQCALTGLNTNYCTNSSAVTLTVGVPGGVFSGNGIVTGTTGVFTPSLAGPGTATVNYNYCSSTYSITSATFATVSTVGNSVTAFYSSGTTSNLDDGTSAALAIGFNFKFYCNTYTNFYICTNGFVTFTGGQTSPWTPAAFPTTTGVLNSIAIPWTDLNLNYGGSITYTTIGTAPSRKLIVSFNAVQHYNGSSGGDPITVQLQLSETTNVIEIHTTTMPINSSTSNHLMGIQNATGTQTAYVVSGRNATNTWSASSECYRWTPGPSCSITQTTVVSPSTISVVGTQSICNGSSATLTASGNTTYTWSTGSNGAVINPAPTSNQSYSVSGTNSFGCVANSVITLTVDNTPTVTATASNGSGVCPGKTVTVNGAGATSYTWSGNTTTVANGVAFTPSVTDTYTVTGLNACGTSTAAITVSIHPVPSVTPVASSPTLCSGTSLTLTGVGNATNYVWSGSVVNGGGFLPSVSATYTVTGTSALSCTASATIPVTVVATPSNVSVVSPTLICLGRSSTLTASGAASYSWSGGAQTANTNSYVVTPSASGISTYTIMRANSTCTTSQVVTVVTNALPNILAVASPSQVCATKPTQLTVAGALTYTWTSPGIFPSTTSFTFTGASPLAFPALPTTYTVAAHDGTCVNTTTVFVQANPNPTIITSASPPTLCSGSTSTINASGGLSYSVTSSSSSNTYTSFPIVETLTTTTAFNVTGFNSFGCAASTIQFVQVSPLPSLSVTVGKPLICSDGSVVVNSSGAHSYSWSSGALTASTIINPTSSVSGQVIYTVTGTFTNTQCQSSKTVGVNVFVPTISVTGNTATCIGGNIFLTALVFGGTASNFRWYTVPGAAASSSIAQSSGTINASAVYTISVLSTTGTAILCPATETINISIYSNPSITAVATRTQICLKESVVLNAGGAVNYYWNTGSPTSSILVSPNATTNYTVTGTDINSCTGTKTIQIKVSGCSGIAEQNAANLGLTIYPNPSNGEFTIQSAADLRLTLVNDIGQLVRVIELSENNNYKVYVDDLARGIYFLSGQKDNYYVSQKLIITK